MTLCGSVLALSLLLLLAIEDRVNGCRPVILMHGLMASSEKMLPLKERIERVLRPNCPNPEVYNIDAYNNEESLKPMWEQVHGVYNIIAPILNRSPDGAILIGYSQGGLIFRGILEAYPTHNITFISLASPLAGQYGAAQVNEIIPLITKDFLYHYCYLGGGKHKVSVCDWWKDPTQLTLYKKTSNYLYQLESTPDKEYKSNFERVKKLVLVGGPDDGIIEPWQSTQFGFYGKNMDVMDCADQQFYVDNSFGLQTLDDNGRLYIHTVPGVQHFHFHKDQRVFDCCIKQWLN